MDSAPEETELEKSTDQKKLEVPKMWAANNQTWFLQYKRIPLLTLQFKEKVFMQKKIWGLFTRLVCYKAFPLQFCLAGSSAKTEGGVFLGSC